MQIKALEWEGEVLQQQLSRASEERDSLRNGFEASVYDVQQKAGEGRVRLLHAT